MLLNSKTVSTLNETLRDEEELVIDLETTGLYCWRGDTILTIQFYLPKAKVVYTAWVGDGDSLLCPERMDIKAIDWVAINKVPLLIMHNAKFDASFLLSAGVSLRHGRFGRHDTMLWDTLTAQWLINNQTMSLSLKSLTADVTPDSDEWKRYAPEGLDLQLARDVTGQRADLAGLAGVDMKAMLAYAESDVILTYILYRREWAKGASALLAQVCRETDLTWAVIDMERRGVGFDWEEYARLKSDMEHELLGLRKSLPFDPMSGNVLMNAFGTSNYQKETLLQVHGEMRDLAQAVVQFRDMQHDYSTFCVKLAEHVSGDGFLHSNFRQNGTITGRFSSNNPNMMGVPKRMRGQFQPVDPDMEYVSYDLAQIELAMGAWYSECRPLLEVFETGGDVHQTTADLMGLDRQTGKRVNFSMVYGIGAPAMSDRLSVSLRQAQEWITGFRKAYPELGITKMRVEGRARRRGYIRLYNGLVRFTPEPHKAWSMLIQSAVAELAKDIIVQVNDYLRQQKCGYLVLHVHDEFVVELPVDATEMQEEIQRIIESCGPPEMVYHADKQPWVKDRKEVVA
jgi:DNA polymerase I